MRKGRVLLLTAAAAILCTFLLWLCASPLVAHILHYGADLLPEAALQADTEYLVFRLLQTPFRILACFVLVVFMWKIWDGESDTITTKPVFYKYFALLQAWYILDLEWYVHRISPLAGYAELGWFAKLLWGQWPSHFALFSIAGVGALASLFWLVRQQNAQLLVVSIMVLAMLEGLVYSFGYQANTFSSWRVVSVFLALELLAANPVQGARVRKIGMVGLALCYFLPGLEKVINGLPAALSGAGLDTLPVAMAYSPFGAYQAQITVGVIAFQLSAICLPFLRSYRLIWCVLAVAFHLSIWLLLGIGGWESPWIWVLPYLLAEKSGK